MKKANKQRFLTTGFLLPTCLMTFHLNMSAATSQPAGPGSLQGAQEMLCIAWLPELLDVFCLCGYSG